VDSVVYEAFIEAYQTVKRVSDRPGENALLMDELNIDSLDAIDMLAAMEKRFDQGIDFERLLGEAEEISTVGQLVGEVTRLLKR
jgi:acyl carrier protein